METATRNYLVTLYRRVLAGNMKARDTFARLSYKLPVSTVVSIINEAKA